VSRSVNSGAPSGSLSLGRGANTTPASRQADKHQFRALTLTLAGLEGVGVDVVVLVPDPGSLDAPQARRPQPTDLLVHRTRSLHCTPRRQGKRGGSVPSAAVRPRPKPIGRRAQEYGLPTSETPLTSGLQLTHLSTTSQNPSPPPSTRRFGNEEIKQTAAQVKFVPHRRPCWSCRCRGRRRSPCP
jgi:hypothetical protein